AVEACRELTPEDFNDIITLRSDVNTSVTIQLIARAYIPGNIERRRIRSVVQCNGCNSVNRRIVDIDNRRRVPSLTLKCGIRSQPCLQRTHAVFSERCRALQPTIGDFEIIAELRDDL